MKRIAPSSNFSARLPRWTWLVILTVLAVTGPVVAARLAAIMQTSAARQVTDPVYPLPPEQDGSIVVTLTGDRPLVSVLPAEDFIRVDATSFATRFPWNWGTARTAVFTDDLGDETTVEIAPALARPFSPLTHDIPVLHISCDSTALWDPETGIYTTGNYVNFLQRGGDWERAARFQYYLPGDGLVVDEPIGLRIHGGYGRNYHQKGLRFYFDDYGTDDILDYRFFDSGPTGFERLILRASRYDDFCINSNFAEVLFADLGHLASRYRFVALYLNREYWGAYSLRERLDDEFFQSTWGLGGDIFNFIKDGETEDGDGDPWWDFLADFDQVSDPTDPQWFAGVRQNLDLASYIDWLLINMYCVPGDNGFAWNLALFQTGEYPWRLVMWDEDLLLRSEDLEADMFRFFTARNEAEWNLYRAPADLRTWNAADQQWLTMFRTLLGNPDFRALFRSRLEHLLDGAMSAENLVARVDALATGQWPEIPAHAERWAGFQADWYQANVERTRQWLTARRPLFLAQAEAFFADFALPPWAGDYTGLVINEFLADNDNDARDEAGDFDDWIEIFNGGPATVNLTGMFLTDDLTQTRQWSFPAVVLPPGERLIVWCDGEPGQGPLHAAFKLSGSGEQIGLFSPDIFGNAVVDTHSFGVQTVNVSEARMPDAGLSWTFLDPPTFNRANDDTSGVPPFVPRAVVLNRNYPNPFNAGTRLEYGLPRNGHVRLGIYDVRGRRVRVLVDESGLAGLHPATWMGDDDSGRPLPSGMYIARLEFGGDVLSRRMTLLR